mmetsp:Transcript_16597/g.25130  ORF Transcript_16597/g.25130 Transcript_16597/m.25130 type:complete len:136 (-) Transcript_16597:457-864(-)|eukprot:CAMPEP_0194569290 /NCGR_PEP_ID=MMETSP0292-20121207/7065_1 /TAXON_ID=39354 /ORGANISM="Heterosigma akashiwo, Strain CCMP2393" /LENGTH=135 /DNA_ID=CAMNT_0039419511 /DNA_START=34 /DNA_END=441 /DNA_ORIENTATION=+
MNKVFILLALLAVCNVSAFFGGSSKSAAKKTAGFTITVDQKGYKGTELVVTDSKPVNLRKYLMENKIDIYPLQGKLSNCGGGGSCGTCKVAVLDGMNNLSPKAPVEKKLLAKYPDNYRLSCCTRATGSCTIKTKP